MADQQLLSKSHRVKKQADKLIKDSKIVEILSKYGKVKFYGSYALDTMLRPDLDIWVVTKKHSYKKLIGVLNSLLKEKYFDELCFADWLTKQQGKIKGFYLQPQVRLEQTNWKLDIWLTTSDQYKPRTEHFLNLLQNEGKNEKKLLILKLKQKYSSKTKYQRGIDGELIYKAVLEKGIRTTRDFMTYIS